MRAVTSLIGLGLMLATPAVGTADEGAAESDVAFEQGQQLMKEQRYDEACAKFEYSYRQSERLGSLLNLAQCNSLRGRYATAWTEFRDVVRLATAQLDTQLDNKASRKALGKQKAKAEERLAEIEPLIPMLVLSLPSDRPARLRIERDGVDITALVDAPIPVDLGTHELIATAPGFDSVSVVIQVDQPGLSYPLEIPALTAAKLEEPGPDPEPPAIPESVPSGAAREEPIDTVDVVARRDPSRRRVAMIVGATGVTTMAVGLGFGLDARSRWGAAHEDGHCDDAEVCDQTGVDLIDRAHRSAGISTALVGVGVTVVAVGAILWFTAPTVSRTEVARISPFVSDTAVGAMLGGTF